MMQGQKDVSFGSVMQRMFQEKRTGILDVSGPDGEWEIHLHRGEVADVRASNQTAWTLGEALVSRGIMNARRLSRLDSWARKRGLQLEDVLVSHGEVSEELVERIQTLHVKETILPLFRKVGIFCHFRHEAPGFLSGARKVSIAELLKEGGRRLKLWPGLEKRIPSLQGVYRKEDGAIPVAFGDLGTDAGQRDAPIEPAANRLTANMKLVFFELNGVKTVRQLAVATGLGEFETAHSLSKLLEKGLVRIVEMEGEGEKPLEISYLPIVGSALSTFLLVAIFAWVAFSWESEIWTGDLAVKERVSSESLEQYQKGSMAYGLMRSAVDRGMFPTTLDVLAVEGWTTGSALDLSGQGREWEYRTSRLSDKFSLRARDRSSVEDVPKTQEAGESSPGSQPGQEGGEVE